MNYPRPEGCASADPCPVCGAREATDACKANSDVGLLAENERLRKALERIARWRGEFPLTGQTWPSGEPMSYGAAYGSNGERDFMRGIAREALGDTASPSPEPQA